MPPENDTAAVPPKPPQSPRADASAPGQTGGAGAPASAATASASAGAKGGASWLRALRRAERWVPMLAVVLVAVTAVATALMSSRFDDTVATQEVETPADPTHVVQAPPLKGSAPAQVAAADRELPDIAAMGGPRACRNCGVVEMVVAVHGYAQPTASGYQMHIRMDDGSVRTVEQRGALAAGSRVVVDRNAVRVLAERAGQG
jgi:hypothetical protein